MTAEDFLEKLAMGESLESLENLALSKAHQRNDVQLFGKGAGSSVAAQFDIKVTRNSGTIDKPLPFALFGILDLEQAYKAVLNMLPGDVTCSVSQSGGNVVFTYVSGGNTDTITVSCSNFPYTSFIKATLVDLFTIRAIRMSISDTTQTGNFDNPLILVRRSIFGKDERDSLVPSSYIDPKNFKDNRVDIGDVRNSSSHVMSIDKEISLVYSLNDTMASGAYTLNFSVFVNKFEKHNAVAKFHI